MYEFLRVESVNGSSVNFAAPKKYWYGNGWRSDANIGVGSDQFRVMLMRVPNYSNVTVNGTLTASTFNGSKYGVVMFRVSNLLNGSGVISANALGFGGGAGYGAGQNGVYNGESASGSGGGAGHATGGTTPWMGGAGGGTYGELTLQRLFLGSGGGSAREHGCGDGECNPGAGGGSGGGIVMVIGQTISYSGSLTSNGGDGLPSSVNYSGAGSGGSLRIEGQTVTLNTVTALGGGAPGGVGGVGRVAVYYQNSLTATTFNPSPYTALLGQAATPTPMPTPINLTTAPDWGNGADGDLIVGGTFNISSQNSGTRSCPDGGDAVSYAVSALTESSVKLSSTPHVNCLKAGDEVMLLHLYADGTNSVNKGNYEYLRVGGVVGDTVYFTTPKVLYYGTGASDDSNIGPNANRVMLIRVPNYRNVTIDGTLTTDTFNGVKNGMIVFRASNTLSGLGIITANKLGFGGSSGYGAGGNGENTDSGYGGGASYATYGSGSGGYGTWGGAAGALYGEASLQKIYYGSGGGNSSEGGPANPGRPGGAGGGMIMISGRTINFSGSIQSNGEDSIAAPRGRLSGAGSGGSILIEGETVTLNTVAASGGGGVNGGLGRIAVYYYTSFSGNFTPGYLKQIYTGATPTATFSPTPTVTAVPQPMTNNLMAYWSLDDASGYRSDSHGINHLADNNTVGSLTGKVGNAGDFESGNSEFLEITDNPSLSTGDIDFMISAWIKLESLTTSGIDMVIASKVEDSLVTEWKLMVDDPTNLAAFRLYDGSGNMIGTVNATSFGVLSTNTWYYVVAWHDSVANTVNIQVNNGAINSNATTGIPSDTSSHFRLGAERASEIQFFDGLIDQVVFYKRILSTTERTWYYNNGNGRSYVDVASYSVSTPTPIPTQQPGWTIRGFTQDSAHPHAVASVTENQLPAASYTYDANGNMTCRTEKGVTYLQTYNTENRIASIAKLASGDCATPGNYQTQWDFAYDGDGVRTATLTTPYVDGQPGAASLSAYYFGGTYEVRSDNTTIKYYSFAGQMIAMDDGTGLQYFLTDHLGSVVAVTDASGALISQQRYLPFGSERTNIGTISQTDYGYTGQRNLGDMGLMDYHARFYSPYLNRFVQPDTLIPDPSNPQAWNRFGYVHNNPINFNDPTGHFPSPDDLLNEMFYAIIDYATNVLRPAYEDVAAIAEKNPIIVDVANAIADQTSKLASNDINTDPQSATWGDLTKMWFYEAGPSSMNFSGGDYTTNYLRQQDEIQLLRNKALDYASQGIYTSEQWAPDDRNMLWVGMNNKQALKSAVLNFNAARLFLGGYMVDSITAEPYSGGGYKLDFTVINVSGWESATRLVRNGDGLGGSGIIDDKPRGRGVHWGGNFSQSWRWSENCISYTCSSIAIPK
ncbi:hypothetical protein HY857_00680 [Candidatus Saccharibacteria bacterium]|nr:hypothetical protein [Candidatus Saccharibacteria bacterium]